LNILSLRVAVVVALQLLEMPIRAAAAQAGFVLERD
jgi:hypothetical protein